MSTKKLKSKSVICIFIFGITALFIHSSYANENLQNNSVDRIYHPYVESAESEIGLFGTYQKDHRKAGDQIFTQTLEIGTALTDRLSLSLGLHGNNTQEESFEIEAYGIESIVQLTEQGEFWADWGLFLEFEKQTKTNAAEAVVGILTAKEFGLWNATTNLFIGYEFGKDVENKFEINGAAQIKYRLTEFFEIGFEIYMNKYTKAIGPIFTGEIAERFTWELGLMEGLSHNSPDHTLRFLIAYGW